MARIWVSMDIEGTYTLQASPQDVWSCLMNQQTLQHAIPGAERFEVLGKDTYDIAMRIGSSPLADFYHGHVTVTERQYPSSFHLAIECEGSQRTINGEGSIHLNEHGENTIIAYEGTLHLSKLATPMPVPVIRGAAKMLIQQFFTSLADRLSATASTPAVTARGKIVLLPTFPKPTLQMSIVRWLGLGTDDTAARAQWASLLRLAAIALGLLLLVWIASKIRKR